MKNNKIETYYPVKTIIKGVIISALVVTTLWQGYMLSYIKSENQRRDYEKAIAEGSQKQTIVYVNTVSGERSDEISVLPAPTEIVPQETHERLLATTSKPMKRYSFDVNNQPTYVDGDFFIGALVTETTMTYVSTEDDSIYSVNSHPIYVDYLGEFHIDGYPMNTEATTATGNKPVANYTCAMNPINMKEYGIEYGDVIRITVETEDYYGVIPYVVDDACAEYGTIRVCCNTVGECYDMIMDTDVYALRNVGGDTVKIWNSRKENPDAYPEGLKNSYFED